MNEAFKKITKKFGVKELILCLVLAAVLTIFIVVFTGNTAKVRFNSVGGSFDEGEGAVVYDYDYYIVGSEEANDRCYHEVLEKSFRISSVATLPEPTREGYNFEGWYYGKVLEDGTISYVYTEKDGTITYDKKFEEDNVKGLEKASTTEVFAKWSPIVGDETAKKSIGENVLAALDITWKGMLGIFLVIGIIFLVIVGLNLITKKTAELKAKKNNDK